MAHARTCLSLVALALTGCGGVASHRGLESLNQPVVERTAYGSAAWVPHCPDWSAQSEVNLKNATYPNYGCAVNANLAAMIADPMDLIRGASDTGYTETMTASKAIASYREARPTGERGLAPSSTQTGGQQ